MTTTRPGLRSVLIALAVTGWFTVTVLLVLQPGSRSTDALISQFSLLVAGPLAGVACLVRAQRSAPGRVRTTWRMFGASALFWALGTSIQTVYVLLDRVPPTPSLADLPFLLIAPLFAVGLLQMAVPEPNLAARLRALLDGLLIGAAVLLVGWVSVIGPVVQASSTGVLGKVVLFYYPVSDVALITLATYLVLRVRGDGVRTTLPVEQISAAVIAFCLGDSAYTYLSLSGEYYNGHPSDAGWLAGLTLLFVAALMPQRPSETENERIPRQIGQLLPYFFIVAATAASLVIPEITGVDDDTTRWIRSALILLMVVRQLLSLQENAALTRELEQRVSTRTQELNTSHKRFQALVENSSDVVSMVDRHGRIIYLSDSVARVFGVPPQIMIGRDIQEYLDEPSRRSMTETLTGIAAEPLATATLEIGAIFPDGRRVTIENTMTNLLDDPSVQAIVLNSRDISERRQLEDELVHQAFHDSLTGLANRSLFLDRVRHAMRRRTNGTESVGVLFLDLDGFKEVNDSLGHATGDALLVDVARRLTGCLRPGDTIARLGGDEFAILVEGATSGDEFVTVASRIREAMEAAIVIDGRDLFIRASIGIASAPVGTVGADQLIRNADLAMYRAKERQDGEPALYDPSMHSTLVERLALEAELRKAIADEQLQVHYQPTYILDSGDLVGVEALVRWPHPERGMVPPDVFIPLAEQTGLIHDLGRFVLRQACFQGQEWSQLSPSMPLSIGVNVSGKQLQRRDFADEVNRALLESGLAAEHLVLEMTESVLMNDTESTVRTLQALKDLGIRIAIDDFGTGYSSLSYLHRFPVDILKIDRSFVERLSGADAEDNLVQSIVQLGHTLKLETIAEGIEEHGQLMALRRLGCTMAQGYHFGRPGPAEVVSKLVAASTEPLALPSTPRS
ncbi:EAL domain-containing protein [Kineosporia rhizophila]|uniref:putative bifunctional diguanylate cyclase/phosphodiesterase n=1 Tax=Kineosporia rhizophila TaxID=84633 RepID=UPI001E483C45|nr:EAL domain-containing protein [Kineosporia rhizophila]MCE0537007.1 EAL domain-containing protein [Kineosporia rhizophila]